jgi:hypothetical protein
MKMTIVTDRAGNIIGAVQGDSLSEKKDGVEATVSFAPGHQLHTVDVDDDMGTIRDLDEYQQRLSSHVPKP